MDFKLDFEQYVPVQHQPTQAYFAFRPPENNDFDAARDEETYLCYVVKKNGKLNTQMPFVFPRKELQPIFILL